MKTELRSTCKQKTDKSNCLSTKQANIQNKQKNNRTKTKQNKKKKNNHQKKLYQPSHQADALTNQPTNKSTTVLF